ncbi:hypothetical protein DFH09DRAFT_628855 [Mycena vulgaris]|nr:hypothetical protein DFH09DRAFT_628855 [Mycena vulgaris]
MTRKTAPGIGLTTRAPGRLPQFTSRWVGGVFYGAISLCLLWLMYPRDSPYTGEAPAVVIDEVAKQLGHPTFYDIRDFERRLPQHRAPRAGAKSTAQPRYLFYPRASWGSGWNNVFQEQLLNTHLAYLSQRAYVFVDYIPRDHPPFADNLPDGTRHWLHVPMNAFVSGPTGGGPMSADGSDPLERRAVSEAWWNVVCPPHRVEVVKLYDTLWNLGLNGKSDGAEMMSKWAKLLRGMTAPCVLIEDGAPFDYLFIGDNRVLSVWPTYGASPTLKYFAWSALIAGALHHNWALLSELPPPWYLTPQSSSFGGAPAYTPYHPAAAPFKGLLGIHVRRGDYEGHCINLAAGGADYNGWNQFGTPGIKAWPTFTREVPPKDAGYVYPALPDWLNVTEGQTRRDAAFAHCWPTPAEIVLRARVVRAESATGDSFPPQALRAVYISTNGERGWVADLARLLKADGWPQVSSTYDMDLTLEQRAVGQAVDMSVLTGAETFIGVGFSSLSSNVAQIRMGSGRHPGTVRFW